MAEAAAALAAHLPRALARYACFSSGVVRLEVPVARGATALQWLAGQELAATPEKAVSGQHPAASPLNS